MRLLAPSSVGSFGQVTATRRSVHAWAGGDVWSRRHTVQEEEYCARVEDAIQARREEVAAQQCKERLQSVAGRTCQRGWGSGSSRGTKRHWASGSVWQGGALEYSACNVITSGEVRFCEDVGSNTASARMLEATLKLSIVPKLCEHVEDNFAATCGSETCLAQAEWTTHLSDTICTQRSRNGGWARLQLQWRRRRWQAWSARRRLVQFAAAAESGEEDVWWRDWCLPTTPLFFQRCCAGRRSFHCIVFSVAGRCNAARRNGAAVTGTKMVA